MNINSSGLARPMECPGYVFLDLHKSEMKPAALDGIAASEHLENLLLDQPIGECASNGVFFDDDMKFHTLIISDDIKSRAVGPILCEQVIDWETRSGIVIKGRYDVCFVDEKGRLCIEDLKYGWGIVEVEKNWQLLAYAIGEIIRRGESFKEISLRIHQPRPHHERGKSREWVISYAELLEYKEKIEARMIEIANGKNNLNTGDHCKYCNGAAQRCPAFNRVFYRSVEVSTEFFEDSLNEKEISEQLEEIQRAEERIKIKKDALSELALIRIKKGELIPGYAQVETYGNRTWKDGITPEAIKLLTGCDIVEKKMASPSRAERLGVPLSLIEGLAEKRFKGLKLKKQNHKEIGNNIFGANAPTNGGKNE